MPDECDGTKMPMECVQRFEHGAEVMAKSAAHIESMGTQVNTMHTLLTGNGSPETGVVYRLKTLEQAADDAGETRGKWQDRLWGLAVGVLLVALTWSLAGCASATKTVQRELSAVQGSVALARESVQNARTKAQQVKTTEPTPAAISLLGGIVSDCDTAEGHLNDIGEAASKAQAVVPDLEDRGNWLTETFGEMGVIIKLVVGTVLVVALAFIGLWAIRRFGYLLPRAKRDEAKLAKAVLAEADPTTAREYIAARRASDPQLNAAMAKQRPPPATGA